MATALISSAVPRLPARRLAGWRVIVNELTGLIFNALMNHLSKIRFQSPFSARGEINCRFLSDLLREPSLEV